jgi:hypothetical protein
MISSKPTSGPEQVPVSVSRARDDCWRHFASKAGFPALRPPRFVPNFGDVLYCPLGGMKDAPAIYLVAGCAFAVAMRWRVADRSASKRGSPCKDWSLSSFSTASISSTELKPSA